MLVFNCRVNNEGAHIKRLTTVFGTADLPGLQLEDGDSVTTTPAFVFATDNVAHNNAMLWRPGRKVSDYLDVAGVDADANFDNLFAVRADGTVIHTSRRGWLSNQGWS